MFQVPLVLRVVVLAHRDVDGVFEAPDLDEGQSQRDEETRPQEHHGQQRRCRGPVPYIALQEHSDGLQIGRESRRNGLREALQKGQHLDLP